jgi:uncharacterized protein YdaU (DUF1376 family)
MAKDPAFLFYPGDWLGGTMGMTLEEKGAYFELLMLQFNRGHLTEHMIVHMVGQHWDNIKDKFLKDEKGNFYNLRLEEEKEKRKNYTQSRRNNNSGKNQYSKKIINKKEHSQVHMSSHMENVNENINNNKDRNENEGECEGDSREIIKIQESLVIFFGFSETEDEDKVKYIYNFLVHLKGIKRLVHFTNQFQAYMLYKNTTKEIQYGFRSFIGMPEKAYEDGGWNRENWITKLERLKAKSLTKAKLPFEINPEIKKDENRLKFE